VTARRKKNLLTPTPSFFPRTREQGGRKISGNVFACGGGGEPSHIGGKRKERKKGLGCGKIPSTRPKKKEKTNTTKNTRDKRKKHETRTHHAHQGHNHEPAPAESGKVGRGPVENSSSNKKGQSSTLRTIKIPLYPPPWEEGGDKKGKTEHKRVWGAKTKAHDANPHPSQGGRCTGSKKEEGQSRNVSGEKT